MTIKVYYLSNDLFRHYGFSSTGVKWASIVDTSAIRRASIMIKKLTKHGNTLSLDISTDAKQQSQAPVQLSVRKPKFDAAQKKAHEKFGKAFNKLAESAS